MLPFLGRRAAGLSVLFMCALLAGFAADRYAGSAANWVAAKATAVREIAAPMLRPCSGRIAFAYCSRVSITIMTARIRRPQTLADDIIMAISLDFAHRRIDELSVPRDMVAVMPSGERAKINEAQSEGGITESQSVVAQWLGIRASIVTSSCASTRRKIDRRARRHRR